ncbi:TOTE conflict system archaeo-eukaryotic primase domain-containing protein [Carnobacterium sp. TMP28]|uniref:TOTE conflict system archaeo-eukaryotic primase domain-containing protein n=1 Tax=Carnobacterium sp. TMP28 TaxID=3397060 RepID=UPI0039DFF660
MNYEDLLKAYNQLEKENKQLKKQVMEFKNKYEIEIEKTNYQIKENEIELTRNSLVKSMKKTTNNGINLNVQPLLNKYSSSSKKVELYQSLFRGRNDSYAKRFVHSKTGKPGYAPAKLKPWDFESKEYAPLDSRVIEQHLRGEIVAGIFPICLDDTCYFLAIDLDEAEWQRDASILRELCTNHEVPIAIERSRSGNGAHIWFFFEEALPAKVARKMGTLLITAAMSLNHQIDFKSYDRLFPNQDTLPKGGFGNLIALPLQKKARIDGNSVFIDHNFQEFED